MLTYIEKYVNHFHIRKMITLSFTKWEVKGSTPYHNINKHKTIAFGSIGTQVLIGTYQSHLLYASVHADQVIQSVMKQGYRSTRN